MNELSQSGQADRQKQPDQPPHRAGSGEAGTANPVHNQRIQEYFGSDRQHAAAPVAPAGHGPASAAERPGPRPEHHGTPDRGDSANYRFRASDLHFSDAGYTLRQHVGSPQREAEINVKAHDNADGTAKITISRWDQDGQAQIEVPRGKDAQHIEISVAALDRGGNITVRHPTDVAVSYKSDNPWTIKEVQTAALGFTKPTTEVPAGGDRTKDRRDNTYSHQVGGTDSHPPGGDRKEAPIPFATKEEQWKVAQDSARNWLIDRLVGLTTSADPTGGLLQQAAARLVQDLRAPEPPAHPANLRQYELRESYEAMQRALSVAEAAGTLVVGPIFETAAGLGKAAEIGEAAKLAEGASPAAGAPGEVSAAEAALEGRNVAPPEPHAPAARPSAVGAEAGIELDRDARPLGGPALEPHPRELPEAGKTPQLDPNRQPVIKPTAPKLRGEPSAPEDHTGTDRRTGTAFHERNAAEIVNNLRVEYDPVAGRPVRLSYDVDAKTLASTPETDRGFARDWSTPGAQGTNAGYSRSGYDRGHLVQREAFKGSEDTERAADLHTHVVPMTRDLNRGPGSPWRAAERATCDLAKQHGSVRVEVEPRYARDPVRLRDGTPVPETISRRVYGPDGRLLRDDTFDNIN